MSSGEYGLIVLGGGAAGLAAARSAVAAGVHPLLVTDGPPGGDCTFTGCVPSKTLIEAAAHGVPFDKAMARMRDTVAAIAATENEQALRAEGVDVLRGRAGFSARRRIEVQGRQLSAATIVLATGASPQVPAIDGLAEADYLTTDTVFDLNDAPMTLAVLGGGALGCELAQAFSRLGVTVTLVEAADRILPRHDPAVSTLLTNVLAAENITVHTGATVASISRAEHAGAVTLHAGSASVTAERLLVATGRAPATSGLRLDHAGVDTDDHGFVVVDDHMATTAAGIYAAGDVTGVFGHTHAADAMGRTAAGSALRRIRRPTFATRAVPQVVFTDPEIATIGTPEHQITDTRARMASLPMSELDRAITAQATTGFVTLIAGPRPVLGNTGGGQILGATIVAQRAGELIDEVALAMSTRMFTGRLAQTVHAYPTWSSALRHTAAQFFGNYGGRSATRLDRR